MAKQKTVPEVLSSLEYELLKEMWSIDGRANAFQFALDCNGDITQIRTKIQEVEERIQNPSESMKGPMSQGASPRLYQDGYLAGLKKALTIMEQALYGVEREVVATRQA